MCSTEAKNKPAGPRLLAAAGRAPVADALEQRLLVMLVVL
jgi:hypothetical protein